MAFRIDLCGCSVLPAIFISHLATSMFFAAVPDFLMEKSCSWISPSEKTEIDSICNSTNLVIKATQMASGRNIVRSLLPSFCVPLFARWRDHTGNSKPLVVAGMVAETFGAVTYLISSMVWSLSPEVTGCLESVVGGLFGETICLLGVSCIIIDNSTPENRTMRLQTMLSILFVANCLASVIYGFILSTTGYVPFYCVVIGLHIVGITLAVFMVEDKKKKPTKFKKNSLWQNIKVVFRSRRNRAVLWFMMVSSALVESYTSAENSIIVYYLQQTFKVTIIEEGLIDAYYAFILALGSLIFPYIFTRIFKWTDYKIGIVSAFFTTIFESARVFVQTRVELYLVVYLGLLKCVLLSIPQSIISKSVKDHELGQFLGMASIIQSIITGFIHKTYADTFNLTYQLYPGTFFGISSFANLVIFILLSISSFLARPPDIDDDTDLKDVEGSPSSAKRINVWVIHKNHT
ncbi:unnamed protein product [Nezara viridula]|uniref:Proton-coupled folate transporter n=1 Tax=Nezara viridula TaxID=85310 RepID=A0A9P0HCP5_NEZVI|nr:unnamed protein product [Nezara viridula]